MGLKGFLKFVEIPTKIASVLPLLLGTAYMYYKFRVFNITNFIIFFVSMICIDMATTAINNYIDFKSAIKKEGYGYEEHNGIIKYKISEKTALKTIIILLCIASVAGFILFLNTNVVVLILGVISFAVGISYTFGPVPISRTPYGEVLSGLIEGLIIIFVAVYIHVYNRHFIIVDYSLYRIIFGLDIKELAHLFIFALPVILGISNIMLANNICDIEEDIHNKRQTLPVIIGEKKSLFLFFLLYLVAYASIIASVVFKIMPIYYIVGLLSSIIVFKNVNIFKDKHIKSETFILSVKNFIILNASNLAILVLCIFVA